MMNNLSKCRVAITQPYVILGGRFEVILGFAKTLNSFGIEPDILCLGAAFSPAEVEQKYGQSVKMKFRPLFPGMPWKSLPQDYQILFFNMFLKRFSRTYDLIIDSGNSQLFLPSVPNILSYVHFPREYRIFSGVPSIHCPDQNFSPLSGEKLSNRLLRLIHKVARPRPVQRIVCNSRYTRECFRQVYPNMPGDAEIIYPPVRTAQYFSDHPLRQKSIVSLGRFAEDKGQLEIIKLARTMPEIRFVLIGFVQKPAYYETCQRYIAEQRLGNVTLLANAPFTDVVKILQSSKYFLHTLINEPFGLSAVQAVAAGCIPIAEEAGGRITDLDGKPFDFSHGRTLVHNRGVLASNGCLHEPALAALRIVETNV